LRALAIDLAMLVLPTPEKQDRKEKKVSLWDKCHISVARGGTDKQQETRGGTEIAK